jgi:hypothetical protein
MTSLDFLAGRDRVLWLFERAMHCARSASDLPLRLARELERLSAPWLIDALKMSPKNRSVILW